MKKLAGLLVLLASGSVTAGQANPAGEAGKAAIGYWTSSYAGTELAGAGCRAPVLPAAVQSAHEIRHASEALSAWQECHRRLIAALGPATADKYIPADVLAAMTPDERAQALRHVATVHGQLAQTLQAEAAPVIARHDAWRNANARVLEQLRSERAAMYASARDGAVAVHSGERAEQSRNERRSLN